MGTRQTLLDRLGYASVADFIRAIHAGPYLRTKAADFQVFTQCALLVTAVFVASTIAWDYAIDPVHAGVAAKLRLLQCAAVLGWALSVWRRVDCVAARCATFAVPLVVEASFIQILAILDNGAAYGMGGFLYFYIFMPFLVLAQPFGFAVLVLTVIAVFPMVAALVGLSAGLDWAIYNAYVWMGLLPILCIMLLFETMYRRICIYRQQVEAQAFTDGPTQIANRRRFLVEGLRSLKLHHRNQRCASLLFVDVDWFKKINDTYGHATGDEAVNHVVRILQSHLRASDLIARYGGEEFLVLLPETDAPAALSMAERMRAAFGENPFHPVAGQPLDPAMTVSIGVSTYRPVARQPPDIDSLIDEADQALYAAKRGGRNRVASTGDCVKPERETSARRARANHADPAGP